MKEQSKSETPKKPQQVRHSHIGDGNIQGRMGTGPRTPANGSKKSSTK